MSTARSVIASESGPVPPPGVAIVDWPVRDAAWRCLIVLGTTTLLAALMGWWSQSVPMGSLIQIVLLLALWRLWLPVTYRLDRDGVVETVWKRWRHIDWLTITRVQIQNRGVLLIADRTNTPLAAIHGIFIPWKDKRAEVLDVIEHFLPSRIELP